jgi:hypothetical protein
MGETLALPTFNFWRKRMKQLDSNKTWETAQHKKGTDLRAASDGRYINHKTATAWTKYYTAVK